MPNPLSCLCTVPTMGKRALRSRLEKSGMRSPRVAACAIWELISAHFLPGSTVREDSSAWDVVTHNQKRARFPSFAECCRVTNGRFVQTEIGMSRQGRLQRGSWKSFASLRHYDGLTSSMRMLRVQSRRPPMVCPLRCRAKTGDAMGRPNWGSSLLGAPDADFFMGKQESSENLPSTRRPKRIPQIQSGGPSLRSPAQAVAGAWLGAQMRLNHGSACCASMIMSPFLLVKNVPLE
jgi:hypothetical protein